jgi:hypothetical protein
MPSNRSKIATRDGGACRTALASAVLGTIALALRSVAAVPPRSVTGPAPQVRPAVDGVLDLFKQRRVVALGDDHSLAQEEAFYSALVRDPRFAEMVGNVVVEFGGESSQGVIDRYVNGEDVPFTELRHVWTETAGWFPGPTALGYVNFFANVRAANLKLPPGHRIKVWLGDPKVDWSKINSFRDIQPYLSRRDENFFRIISDEILKKGKIDKTYPNSLAVVSPFVGYIEPECNAKFLATVKNWPVPALAWPVGGTWLKSELGLGGCNFISTGQVEQIKKVAARTPPPGVRWPGPGPPPTAAEMIAGFSSMVSGVDSDAILYLGPPDTFTRSPIEDSIYLDPGYFKEENRRARCCTPNGELLDWDQILRENSVVPKKMESAQ